MVKKAVLLWPAWDWASIKRLERTTQRRNWQSGPAGEYAGGTQPLQESEGQGMTGKD
jgi:hypothetical protein